MKKILLLSAAVALFAACSNDREQLASDGGSEVLVPLRISASNIDVSTQVATRASGTIWGDGDAIGVYARFTDESPLSTQCNALNAQYTITTGANSKPSAYDYKQFTSTSPVYLPTNGDNIYVYAYYPHKSTGTGTGHAQTNGDVYITVDGQATATDVRTGIDFMAAYEQYSNKGTDGNDAAIPVAINKANPRCNLLFEHKLTKLVFKLKQGTGFDDATIAGTTSLTIGSQKTIGIYNVYNRALSYSGSADQTITAFKASDVANGDGEFDARFEAIVLPNHATNNTPVDRLVTITIGDQDYTFTIYYTGASTPKVESFAAGMEYTFEVTVNKTGLNVYAAIAPWNTTTIQNVAAE